MVIISWNVNGIRAVHRKNLFLPFIKEYQPDILCLQETKAERGQIEIDLPDYTEYWNSAEKKGYSGTAIFTKTKPQNVILGLSEELERKYKLSDDSYGDPNKEGRLVTAEYADFYVLSVYTPNAKDDPAFLTYMKELEKKKPVIFCGDLNVAHTEIDLAHPKANEGHKGFTKEEREGIEAMIDAGFVDSFRMFEKGPGHYTWWSPWSNARVRNVGWRIDYIFVSKDLAKRVKKASILPQVMGSDHCPVLIELG